MQTSENVNDYDLKAMIKEFEAASRHEEYLKKIKKNGQMKVKNITKTLLICVNFKKKHIKKKIKN